MKFLLAILLVLSTSCSLFDRREEPPSRTEEVPGSEKPTEAAPAAQVTESSHGAPVVEVAAAHADTAVASHHEVKGTDADVALRYLKNGNTRYLKGNLRKDGQSKKDIKRLSKGQEPHSIVLSCSDSRVPPEVIFDQKLGELFVVRSAGETIEATEIGSMEYAVEHLGSKNIVVMGHTKCGAVKAAFETLGGKDTGSPNINKLVGDIHPRIANFQGKAPSSNLESESWANVEGVAADLLERSAMLRVKVMAGEVKIRKALYDLDTGKVEFR